MKPHISIITHNEYFHSDEKEEDFFFGTTMGQCQFNIISQSYVQHGVTHFLE